MNSVTMIGNTENISSLTANNAHKAKVLLEMILDEVQMNGMLGFIEIFSEPFDNDKRKSFVRIRNSALIAKGVEPSDVGRIVLGLDKIHIEQFGGKGFLNWENRAIQTQQEKTGENIFRIKSEDIDKITVISLFGEDKIATVEEMIQKLQKRLEPDADKPKNQKEKPNVECAIKKLVPSYDHTKTKWNDIEIKFTSEFDVEIYVKGKYQCKCSYEDLQFAD